VRIGGSNMSLSHADGTIAYLVLNLDPNAPMDIYPVELEVRRLGAIGVNNPIPYTTTDGYVEILRAMLGDVDGDGEITVFDSQMVLLYLAGLTTFASWQYVAASVHPLTTIGTPDILDATMILHIAIGLLPHPGHVSLYRIGSFGAFSASLEIEVQSVDIPQPMSFVPFSNNIVSVPVEVLWNPGMSGFDLTLNYDSAMLNPIGFTRGGAWTGMTIVNYNTSGDFVKIVGASGNSETADGTIAYIVFETLGFVVDISNYLDLEVVGLAHVYASQIERLGGFTIDNTSIMFEAPIEEDLCAYRISLGEAIAYAEGLSLADFTRLSWMSLQNALNIAKTIYSNINATQAQMDATEANLRVAINDLVAIPSAPTLDRVSLGEVVAYAQALNPADFPRLRWLPLQNALNAAMVVYGNVNATQEQVDIAEANLRTALANLV
jgi:hypothetical protein